MKTVYAMMTQDFERTTFTCNALIARGARILNVDRDTVSCQGVISEEYHIWFEHESADCIEWRDEVRKSVDALLGRGRDVRILTGHKDGGMDGRLKIEVLDEPGPGGACHQYRISEDTEGETSMPGYVIKFQKGPVKENGLNGITQEVLLEIVWDRLEGFQSGDFACEANQIALDHVRAAIKSLQERTKDRVDRNVEGTNEQ